MVYTGGIGIIGGDWYTRMALHLISDGTMEALQGHRDRRLGSLFRVDEPARVVLIQIHDDYLLKKTSDSCMIGQLLLSLHHETADIDIRRLL